MGSSAYRSQHQTFTMNQEDFQTPIHLSLRTFEAERICEGELARSVGSKDAGGLLVKIFLDPSLLLRGSVLLRESLPYLI